MPARKAPTARQQRLGAELRRMRERSGRSIADGAALLGTDRTNISNMEAGRSGVSADRVRTLAANYACPDPAYVDALADMAEERVKGWWEEYRGVLSAGAVDLAELEHYARTITMVQAIYVPGLLQTEEYARGILGATVPAPAPLELQRRVSHRMKRRSILERESPTPCRFILLEAVLRMRLAGLEIQCRQLQRLLEATEQDAVTIQVVPFEASHYPGAGSAITYVEGPVPQLDAVQLDTAHGSVFCDAETQLINYRAVLARMSDVALSVEESHELIRAVLEELRKV